MHPSFRTCQLSLLSYVPSITGIQTDRVCKFIRVFSLLFLALVMGGLKVVIGETGGFGSTRVTLARDVIGSSTVSRSAVIGKLTQLRTSLQKEHALAVSLPRRCPVRVRRR